MRPGRRTYREDPLTHDWIDARLYDQKYGVISKRDGIIFRVRTYNNLGPVPIRVDSRGTLKRILKARNLIEAG